MKKLLLVLMANLCLLSVQAAQLDKIQLVDQIFEHSSIKINIKNIPNQLAQMPAMLPLEQEQKLQFINDFSNQLATSFNEAEVLQLSQDHFVKQGDTDKLKKILSWLKSPLGQKVTQLELLAQAKAMDFEALNNYMLQYKPEVIGQDKHQQIVRIVNEMGLADLTMDMMEQLMPKMMQSMQPLFVKDKGQEQYQAMMQQMPAQFELMRKQMQPVMMQSLVPAIAYQYQDLSADELRQYADFSASAAGKHYMDLAMNSTMDYAINWVTDAMPTLIKAIQQGANQ